MSFFKKLIRLKEYFNLIIEVINQNFIQFLNLD